MCKVWHLSYLLAFSLKAKLSTLRPEDPGSVIPFNSAGCFTIRVQMGDLLQTNQQVGELSPKWVESLRLRFKIREEPNQSVKCDKWVTANDSETQHFSCGSLDAEYRLITLSSMTQQHKEKKSKKTESHFALRGLTSFKGFAWKEANLSGPFFPLLCCQSQRQH